MILPDSEFLIITQDSDDIHTAELNPKPETGELFGLHDTALDNSNVKIRAANEHHAGKAIWQETSCSDGLPTDDNDTR